MIRVAASNGASLIVFPEMYLTGYTAGRMLPGLAEYADGYSFKKMADCAAEYGIYVAYGFPEKRKGSNAVYNSQNFISDKGELIGTYAKSHLFAGETKNFTPGSEFPVFDTALGRIGLLVCYDLEFPETARRLACRGAEVIISISANMAPYGDTHEHFARSRAMENGVYLVYCNYTGSDDRFTYVGKSGVYAPDGSITPSHPGDAEGLLYADIAPEKTRNINPDIDYLKYISEEERSFYLR